MLDEGDRHLILTFSTRRLQPFKKWHYYFHHYLYGLLIIYGKLVNRACLSCAHHLGGDDEKYELPSLKSQGIFPRTHWYNGHNLLLDFTNILDVGSFASTQCGIPIFSPLLVEEVLVWNSCSIL